MTKDEALNKMAENARELGLDYEPDQVPIGYLCENAVGHKYFRWKKPFSVYKPIPLYTTPPQRTWVGLTDEDLIECERLAGIRHRIHMGSIRGQQLSPADEFLWHYARAIEAAHGIKE